MTIIKSTMLALAASLAVNAFAAETMVISSVTPVPGTTISQFNNVQLVLDEPFDFTEVKVTGDISYTVTDYGTNTVTAGYPITMTRAKDGTIRIGFTDATANEMMDAGAWPVTAPGIYTVNIAAGALTVSGDDGLTYVNEAISYRYDLLPAVTVESVPANGASVGEVKEHIQLTFPTFEKVTTTALFSATLQSATGTSVALGTPSVMENVLLLPLADGILSTAGKYTLTIPTGSLSLTGNSTQVNSDITIEFEVLGITKPIVQSVSPENNSVVEMLGSVALLYNINPMTNPACNETLKLYFNDELVKEFNNKTTNIQFAIDNEDPGLVTYVFAKSLTDIYRKSGSYRVEIPEGFVMFRSGSEVFYSEALTLNYTIPLRFDYTVEPAAGTVQKVSDITLTFADAVSITANELEADEEGTGIIRLSSLQALDEDIHPELKIEGNKVTFVIPTQTTIGEYVLDVPMGAFNITNAAGETVLSQTIEVRYYIPNLPMPTVTPTPGEVMQLDQLVVTMGEGVTIERWLLTPSLKPINEDGSFGTTIETYKRDNLTESAKGKKAVTLVPNYNRQINPGKYVLVISKSTFQATIDEGFDYQGGFNQQQYNYYYTVVENPAARMEPQFADEHVFNGEIDGFKLYFPEAPKLELNPDHSAVKVSTTDGEYNEATEITLTVAGNSVDLAINPPLDVNGTYNFTIPYRTLAVNGYYVHEISLQYGLTGGHTGVASVEGENETVSVYTIDGKVIALDAEKSVVETLPAGLYIVNGKKVVIK